MKAIYKYPLSITDHQRVRMSEEAKILTVMVQEYTVCLWVEMDTDRPSNERVIWIFGPGHFMPALNLTYIGSVLQHQLVWHVYEETV